MSHALPSTQSATFRFSSFKFLTFYLYCLEFRKVNYDDVRKRQTGFCWPASDLSAVERRVSAPTAQTVLSIGQYDHMHDVHPGVLISSVVNEWPYRCGCGHPCSPLCGLQHVSDGLQAILLFHSTQWLLFSKPASSPSLHVLLWAEGVSTSHPPHVPPCT